ncbi:MAG: hypothetical protein ACOC4Z_01680 [Patescibacteria group bacterium]
MTSILLRLAVASALTLATLSPSTKTENSVRMEKIPETHVSQEITAVRDQRVESLSKYLKRYNSPLTEEADTFVQVADENGLDWRFLPAIAGMESLFGNRVAPGTHNPFGWGGGHIAFASWEEAIETVGKSIGERSRSGKIYGPEDWAQIYCPPNWRNWTVGVKYFMAEIGEANAVFAEGGKGEEQA